MNRRKFNFTIGIVLLLFMMNFIPVAYSQSVYQTYFWINDTGNQLSAIQTTGDLNIDHVQVSEIVVSGKGNITLIDGIEGKFLSNYSIPSNYTYNALATGNLDVDSTSEIVAGSLDGKLLTAIKYNQSTQKLTLLWEKSYNVTHIQIADINNDSINEVIVGDALGNLTALHYNGSLLWSYNLTESIGNFKCVDLTEDNVIDAILVLTDSIVTLMNITGEERWNVSVNNKPLNILLGDVMGTSNPEIIIKGAQITNAFTQNGSVLWNSSSYQSSSPAMLLYNYNGSSKLEVLIGINNGSLFLNGTDGSVLHSFYSGNSVTALGISNFFTGSQEYLLMGDSSSNITLWYLDGQPLTDSLGRHYNITLEGAILDIILIDLNADGLLDIVAATSNGSIYVIGVPWSIDMNWAFAGIGIACAIIVVSIIIVWKNKPPKTPRNVSEIQVFKKF